ncbi:MAG: iron chelate uptake ABC transporter family permease subunit, partial [Chloroflexi bacterium]|nr:iron chelate uptake ABC transporter family permease subunit [Chloroflexota bacterium]
MLRSSVRKHSGSLAASPVIRRLFSGAAVIGLLLIIASLIALSTGPVAITPTDTLSALFEWAGFGDSSASRTQQAVIENIRIPRLLLALGAGAGLGVAGATMQGLFRNPLADPGIIGVSAGGALGAVIAISTGFATTSALFLPAFAFV